MKTPQNGFISYLNSLHNVTANGANALAESQALSPYFSELYEPFLIVEQLVYLLQDASERVVVLTGHAGDGKSTVALDVLKRLRGLDLKEPLDKPLAELEEIPESHVCIVKDMSELSAENRNTWLKQAFNDQGSWLIVSNTGPLLQSILSYAENHGEAVQGLESNLLEVLDTPLDDTLSTEHTLKGLGKDLVIVNLTLLDNVSLGSKLLTKLVNHSAWSACNNCSVSEACPIKLNRNALKESVDIVEERIRWIYKRVNAYEQRLTLRQMVAQIAFGITGGMSCEEANEIVESSTAQAQDKGSEGLERIIFSEGFFGYQGGKPSVNAQNLHAVSLLQREPFGASVSVAYDKALTQSNLMGWATIPKSLEYLVTHWRNRAVSSEAVRWRFALRRLAYIFGNVEETASAKAYGFLDHFVRSPSLRELDGWQLAGKLTLGRRDTKLLKNTCLQVLLEVYSGFSSGQFRSQDNLYITLRRPDRAVVQPTQLVIRTISFKEFFLEFDPVKRILILQHQSGANLPLTLPLLDYIRQRGVGELGSALSPIHRAQLDWFQSELLRATENQRRSEDEIELLRAGISGEVQIHRFLMDKENGVLESDE
ncbi:MAG: hypothetical protein OQK12_03135 [Motiliproteus sp.]|nr:hypothetical protein [Motiliproteus sp.]MCW9053515.1 hypothetical protein [Motiliproteus sp.]